MAEWGDDDFYGAQCEMDDQMLLAADEEGSDDSVEQLSRGDQEYERKFSEKEAEFCEPQVHFEKKLRISRGRRSYEDNEEVTEEVSEEATEEVTEEVLESVEEESSASRKSIW